MKDLTTDLNQKNNFLNKFVNFVDKILKEKIYNNDTDLNPTKFDYLENKEKVIKKEFNWQKNSFSIVLIDDDETYELIGYDQRFKTTIDFIISFEDNNLVSIKNTFVDSANDPENTTLLCNYKSGQVLKYESDDGMYFHKENFEKLGKKVFLEDKIIYDILFRKISYWKVFCNMKFFVQDKYSFNNINLNSLKSLFVFAIYDSKILDDCLWVNFWNNDTCGWLEWFEKETSINKIGMLKRVWTTMKDEEKQEVKSKAIQSKMFELNEILQNIENK